MKRFLIRFFTTAVILGILAVAWAYFWPRMTDDKTLIAPASLEAFYPATGSSEKWERVFGPDSTAFDAEFALLRNSLEDPELLTEQVRKFEALLRAASDLAHSTDWDIPPFDENQEPQTDFDKYRAYIRLVCTISKTQHLDDYRNAASLSETYLTRSKSIVDYMIAMASLRLLHEAGARSDGYVGEWREALGRAIKSEYYFARSSPDLVDSVFLFQEKKTWNKMWSHFSFLAGSIQKNDIVLAEKQSEAIATEWMYWPYSNLVGELLLSMAIPSLAHIYEYSLALEQSILSAGATDLK
jgi:hypothetical protein